MAMATQRSTVAAAILTCGRADLENARIVRMHSTLDLETLLVSESLRGEVENSDGLAITGEPVPMTFDAQGRLFIITQDYDGNPNADTSGIPSGPPDALGNPTLPVYRDGNGRLSALFSIGYAVARNGDEVFEYALW